ncbi:hypothetical protein ACJJTC_001950 [Scirpophaga incertulas]
MFLFATVLTLYYLCASAASQNILSLNVNHDKSDSVGVKIPLIGDDNNVISLLGTKTSMGAFNKGFAVDNVNSHGALLTHTSIPKFGSQITGAGKLNLLHNNHHNLNANAFVTRNMPDKPSIPIFNTVGGSFDYMFGNKMGASVGVANTPFLQRTDYSALGKLNLYSSPRASVDLNAGFGRSISPKLRSDWQPLGGLTFTRYW